jgi:hypothetical protein
MNKTYLLATPKEDLVQMVRKHTSSEGMIGAAILSKTLYYYTFKGIMVYPKAKIKFLHVAELYADLTHPNVYIASNLPLIAAIFGDPPFTIRVFDDWWDLVEIKSGAYSLDTINASVREDINLSQIIQYTGVASFDLWIQDGMDRYISLEDEKKLDSIFDNQDDK